ncbi:hypothetical protein K438DRAFT_2033461 [Mycena galopus ATCC 62051]|nr:hypothetical protein K438DRAFT_2033461 [Mycena galopus ATCC 62051]
MQILSLQGLKAIPLRQLALLTFFGIGRLTFTDFSSLHLVAESRKRTIDAVPLPRDTPVLGLGTWGVRRPCMASACVAGERLRVIPGKVAKIQDGASSSPHSLPAVHPDWREILFQNRSAVVYITFLTPDMLMAPKLPMSAETQGVLLEMKKRMPVGVCPSHYLFMPSLSSSCSFLVFVRSPPQVANAAPTPRSPPTGAN